MKACNNDRVRSTSLMALPSFWNKTDRVIKQLSNIDSAAAYCCWSWWYIVVLRKCALEHSALSSDETMSEVFEWAPKVEEISFWQASANRSARPNDLDAAVLKGRNGSVPELRSVSVCNVYYTEHEKVNIYIPCVAIDNDDGTEDRFSVFDFKSWAPSLREKQDATSTASPSRCELSNSRRASRTRITDPTSNWEDIGIEGSSIKLRRE